MKKTTLFMTTALLFVGITSLQAAEKKGAKPDDSPGWLVIEDDLWVPWRYEAIDWLHDAQVHYRAKEEKAAANELKKAEMWLRFAASHAYPETKKSLEKAADDLHTLHMDIGKGKIVSASLLDYAMSSADHALAEWHYFKAKDALGKSDEKTAAQHIQTAARYLQNAADSAHYEYGDDAVTFFDDVDKYGDFLDEDVVYDANELGDDLTSLHSAVQKMEDVLKKASK